MSKYIIKDWADNKCFRGKRFKTFEDAWGYIYECFDHLAENEFDEQMSEFYVEEI